MQGKYIPYLHKVSRLSIYLQKQKNFLKNFETSTIPLLFLDNIVNLFRQSRQSFQSLYSCQSIRFKFFWEMFRKFSENIGNFRQIFFQEGIKNEQLSVESTLYCFWYLSNLRSSGVYLI